MVSHESAGRLLSYDNLSKLIEHEPHGLLVSRTHFCFSPKIQKWINTLALLNKQTTLNFCTIMGYDAREFFFRTGAITSWIIQQHAAHQ
jgi:hypothetical protein